MGPQEESQEYGESEQVHDTVPYNFADWADDIATVAQRPYDEVDDPDAGQEEGSPKESAARASGWAGEFVTTGVENKVRAVS